MFNKLISDLFLPKLSSNTDDLTVQYLICNEQHQQQTLKQLAETTDFSKINRMHLGFSIWSNLDIISITKPACAIILDFDPAVHSFTYPILTKSIKSSNSVDQFITYFLKNMSVNFSFEPMKDYFLNEFEQLKNLEYGFLANESNFQFVKQMIEEEKILFGQGDLTDSKMIDVLSQWIDNKKLVLDTLYLSNIPEWLYQQNKNNWKNVSDIFQKKLVKSDSLIIDAFYPTKKKQGSGPPQRINIGNMPVLSIKSLNDDNDKKDSLVNKSTLFSKKNTNEVKKRLLDSESCNSDESSNVNLEDDVNSEKKINPKRRKLF